MKRFGAAAVGIALALSACRTAPEGDVSRTETFTYLKIVPGGTRTECTFTLTRDAAGRSITSVTERGKTVMTVAARYGAEDELLDAEARLNTGPPVRVRGTDGKASVRAEGKEPQEFRVPRGVIVTSAPDWTDTFSLCRLFNMDVQQPLQEFGGLWIHPTKRSFTLTLSAELAGSTVLRHEGGGIRLFLLTLRLRNNSRYAAWVDSKGRMIKLVSLPFKPGRFQMMLAGFEDSAAGLKPE